MGDTHTQVIFRARRCGGRAGSRKTPKKGSWRREPFSLRKGRDPRERIPTRAKIPEGVRFRGRNGTQWRTFASRPCAKIAREGVCAFAWGIKFAAVLPIEGRRSWAGN